jgi:hypothetical protein
VWFIECSECVRSCYVSDSALLWLRLCRECVRSCYVSGLQFYDLSQILLSIDLGGLPKFFVGVMDSMMALNARVGACRLLLEQHEEGSAIHKSLSCLQSAAICEMIAATVMTADISSAVGTRVVQVKWGSPEDCNAILAALSASSKSLVLPAGKRRRMQQDYRNIVHYVSAMVWEQLQDSDVPGSSKLNLILNLAIVLGCRCPSEHTVKLVCSFWLMVAESEEGLLKMSPDQKKVMLMHVKQTFQGLLKAAADPPQFITLLPMPLVFLRDHALMYHVAFSGGQVPAPTCIDMKSLTALDLSYSCRGGAKSVVHLGGSMPSSPSSASSSSGGLQVALCDSPLERMANTFMSRIESMANQQQRMMEIMVGGGTGNVSTGPRSLLALANGDHASAIRRVPAFAFGSQLALPDNVSAPPQFAPVAPPAAAAQQLEQLAIVVPPAAMAPQLAQLPCVAQPAAATPPTRASAAQDVKEMLDMLSVRNDGKKTTKGRKTKTLAIEGEAEAEETADAHPAPAKAAPPKAKAVPKASPVKANAAPINAKAAPAKASPVKAKAAPPLAKAKAAPPPANAKAAPPPAKEKANAAPRVLGCSKCRWGKGGCAQCRNPEFNGFRYSV